MAERWIEGHFEAIYCGDPLPASPEHAAGRRFDFELQSGSVWDRSDGSPGGPVDGREIHFDRLEKVKLISAEPDAPVEERDLVDLRIRDWRLMHPAEIKGRAYGTLVGTVRARIAPEPEPPSALEPEIPSGPRAWNEEELVPVDPPRASRRLPLAVGDVVHDRLLRAALFLTLLVGVGLAVVCGAATATIWAAPVVVATGLRRFTRRWRWGSPRGHTVLGIALVASQLYLLASPLHSLWQLGCRVPIWEGLVWSGIPLVLAGALRRPGALLLTGTLWTLAMCSWCGAIDGACPVVPTSPSTTEAVPGSAPATEAVPGGRAEPAPSPPSPHTRGPRTDASGRWPRFDPPRRGAPGGGSSGAPLVGVPGGPGGTLGGLPSSSPSGAQARVPSRSPQAGSSSRAEAGNATAGFRDGRPGATWGSEFRGGDGPATIPGGWVAPSNRGDPAPAGLISIEHANRVPDSFYRNTSGARVYVPTDPIFEPGTAQLRKRAQIELARVAALLSLHPERRTRLEVHTDSGGKADARLALSRERARVVHAWLLHRGHVSPDQFETLGVGSARPLVPPDGDLAAQSPNRRIEIHLVDGVGRSG